MVIHSIIKQLLNAAAHPLRGECEEDDEGVEDYPYDDYTTVLKVLGTNPIPSAEITMAIELLISDMLDDDEAAEALIDGFDEVFEAELKKLRRGRETVEAANTCLIDPCDFLSPEDGKELTDDDTDVDGIRRRFDEIYKRPPFKEPRGADEVRRAAAYNRAWIKIIQKAYKKQQVRTHEDEAVYS